jgi:hypothetical protein
VNYVLQSSFTEKKFYKEPSCVTSDWLPGINLATFSMLYGVYPTNVMLYKQLQAFKEIEHNDLVLANIIVQGDALKLIDFADDRRSSDPRVCLKGVLKMFNNVRRLQDAQRSLEKYHDYIKKHVHDMHSL